MAPSLRAVDPVAAAWARTFGARDPKRTLLVRRWLDRGSGEAPSRAQAASWLDLKRTYLELRRDLQWVYLVLRDPRPYAEVAARLGFAPHSEPVVGLAGEDWHLFVLDMGPGAVDGWLNNVVAKELAPAADEGRHLLDVDARELVLADGRVGLTPLEFGLLRYLHERPGKAVSRYELLEAVWDYSTPTSSNVVDSVVKTLRRKLGSQGAAIETVRGTGYRYRETVGT
jgi:hypothetical protein